jgi:3-phenylpropionate/cinnamic acid dioxygenase small subunit
VTSADQQIASALHRCAFALDEGRWDDLGNLFTEDAVGMFGELGGVRNGREAIVRFCSRALGQFDAVQHFISNVEMTVDREQASSRCYLHAVHIRPGAGSLMHIGAEYLDRWVLDAGVWRIAHRTVRVVWATGTDDA